MELNLQDYQNYLVEELKERVRGLRDRELWILTDGVDSQCKTYMKSKLNWGKELGMKPKVIEIKNLEDLELTMTAVDVYGIPTIMQLPIKKEFEDCYNSWKPDTDVDGFYSYQNIAEGEYDIVPATPKGCLRYMIDSEGLNLNLRNKSVVIVGRGKLVGYPLAMMCMNEGATVSVINTKTESSLRKSLLLKADVVILATGHKGSVKDYELSSHKEVYVLNVGTCFDENGKLTTELKITGDYENIHYTPRIKGIGVLTVLSLYDNVINFYEKRL